MSSFSFEQYNARKDQPFTTNRNVIQIRTHDPLNNPNRPEFMSRGGTARELFRHAYRTLSGLDGPAAANAYWSNLLTTASRATRDPSEERNVRDRRSGEVEIALAATDDAVNGDQLRGGMMAAMARRDIYSDLPDSISRREKTAVIDYLTARALGEATGTAGDLREPRGTVGREATRQLEGDNYQLLANGVAQIYNATQPDPSDEMSVDFDNLDEAGQAREAELAESTRVRKAQNIIRSFADSYLREPIDQANTVAGGEQNLQNTMFVMESAQEAAVMEALVGWAQKRAIENGGQLPDRATIDNDLRNGKDSVYNELQKHVVQTVSTKTTYTEAQIDRLQLIIDPNRALNARIELADQAERRAAQTAALEAWIAADPEKNTDDNFKFEYKPDAKAVAERNAKLAAEVKKDVTDALSNPGTRALLQRAVEQQNKTFNTMSDEQRQRHEEAALRNPKLATHKDVRRLAAMLGAQEEIDGKLGPKPLYRTQEMARVAQAFMGTLTQENARKFVPEKNAWVQSDKKSWAQIENRETIQRRPIFGEKASQFDFMRATVVEGATFYKNGDAVKEKIAALDTENRAIQDAMRSGKPRMENGRPVYPGSILIGENLTNSGQSLPLQAALEQAHAANMPVVRLSVIYNRSEQIEVNDAAEQTKRQDKSLRYVVSYTDLDRSGKEVPKQAELFYDPAQDGGRRSGENEMGDHRAAMKALSGALVVVEGRATNSDGEYNRSQGQMIRWQALTDMATEVVVFGHGVGSGRSDYNANQMIRLAAENGKLAAVYDDSGRELADKSGAIQMSKGIANNKVETALKAIGLIEARETRKTENPDKVAVHENLDTVYAQLLVHNMHLNRTNAPARLAEINGTVGDLFKVAEARSNGGKDLDADTRARYQQIAKIIPADTFSVDSVENIRQIGNASAEAKRGMARIQDKNFEIEFNGPGTSSGPVLSAGRQRTYADMTQTPNMMMVGGTGTPTEAQRKAIEDSVAEVAKRGYGIVTVATKGANEAVIDAALKHDAKITVVMADSPLVSEVTGDVRRRLGEVARSDNGLVVAKYDMLDVPGRENERERMAYKLAGELSDGAVMVKGHAAERAVFEVAKFGQDKPVAALPAYSLQDTGNKLLTEPFASAYSSRVIGTAVSSSFYSSMTPDGRWQTMRENEPIVTAHERVETSVTWHDPATHMRAPGAVGEFVGKWADSVTAGQERGMVNPEIKTERDLAIAMGRESAPIDMAKFATPEAGNNKEAELQVSLRDERERVAANANRPEPRRRAAGGMEM